MTDTDTDTDTKKAYWIGSRNSESCCSHVETRSEATPRERAAGARSAARAMGAHRVELVIGGETVERRNARGRLLRPQL